MTSIPHSYHEAGACQRLDIDKSGFTRSGLRDKITQYQAGDHAHYDHRDVEEWRMRLMRREALIRLGVLHKTAPLLKAPAYDEYDFPCPKCSGLAVWKPPQSKEERSAWHTLHENESTHHPAACSQCEWIQTPHTTQKGQQWK